MLLLLLVACLPEITPPALCEPLPVEINASCVEPYVGSIEFQSTATDAQFDVRLPTAVWRDGGELTLTEADATCRDKVCVHLGLNCTDENLNHCEDWVGAAGTVDAPGNTDGLEASINVEMRRADKVRNNYRITDDEPTWCLRAQVMTGYDLNAKRRTCR